MLKLIPDLENSRDVRALVQTSWGQFFIAALFALSLALVNNANWLLASSVILLFSLFRSQRFYLSLIVSVLSWFFLDSIFDFRTQYASQSHMNLLRHYADLQKISASFPAAPLLITFIGVAFVLFLHSVYLRFFKQWPVILFLMLPVALLALTLETPMSTPALSLFVAGSFIILTKSFWFLAYGMDYFKFSKPQKPWLSLGAIAPFWTFHFIRIHVAPRGIGELRAIERKNSEELADCQIRGLKLAFWCLICKYVAEIATFVIWGRSNFSWIDALNLPSFHFHPFLAPSLRSYNELNIPLLEKWFILFVRPALYILSECVADCGLIIAFLRLMGFDAKRHVYKPHLATNFNQFFQRIYFYYNAVLVQFFFFPIARFLRPLNSHPKLRLFLSVFFTITLGGMTLHFLRETLIVMEVGPLRALQMTSHRLFYFAGIGLASAISSVKNRDRSQRRVREKFQPFKFLSVYSIYAFFFSLQGNIMVDTPMDQISYLMSLFGVK